jgi:hypothetical protein
MIMSWTRSLSFLSDGEEIASNIARRDKYRGCWIQYLVGFFIF